jgi:hypothetical protein
MFLPPPLFLESIRKSFQVSHLFIQIFVLFSMKGLYLGKKNRNRVIYVCFFKLCYERPPTKYSF